MSSRYQGDSDECPVCGLTYEKLRTGLSFQAVIDLMKDWSDDSADWKYKRRNTVLGKWHEIKKELWSRHQLDCVEQRAFENEQLRQETELLNDAYVPPGATYAGPLGDDPF